jgi:hypothetical protein
MYKSARVSAAITEGQKPFSADFEAAQSERDNAVTQLAKLAEHYPAAVYEALLRTGIPLHAFGADLAFARGEPLPTSEAFCIQTADEAFAKLRAVDRAAIEERTSLVRTNATPAKASAARVSTSRSAAPLASIIGGLARGIGALGGGLAMGVSSSIAEARRAAAASKAAEVGDVQQSAESAITLAEDASAKVVAAARRVRSSDSYQTLRSQIEQLSRQTGRGMTDTIREMKPGGAHADLRKAFDAAVTAPGDFGADYDELTDALDRHEEAWTQAAEKTREAGGDPQKLWTQLGRAYATVRDVTQDIPGAPGKTFADRARDLVDAVGRIIRDLLGASKATNIRRPSVAAYGR